MSATVARKPNVCSAPSRSLLRISAASASYSIGTSTNQWVAANSLIHGNVSRRARGDGSIVSTARVLIILSANRRATTDPLLCSQRSAHVVIPASKDKPLINMIDFLPRQKIVAAAVHLHQHGLASVLGSVR